MSPQTPFPELGFKTLEQTYSQHDIEFCPPTPPFPELGFKTLELNASRDRGQYDFYITAIEIGNDRKFNKLHP